VYDEKMSSSSLYVLFVRLSLVGSALLFSFLLGTSFTYAASQLLISEIHYNPVGTDDKHEYIEVCNVGSDAQDIAGYKLYESSSNHSLTLSRGSSTLGTNSCAVFVTDPATFMTDYPSFSATLFDTSFSLSNTGEALILRDGNLADVDGVSFTSSMGGNGDGQTLHRSGSSFTAGAASPGSEVGLVGTSSGAGTNTTGTGTPNTDTNTTPADTTTPPSVTTIFHTVTIEPPAQLFVRTAPSITTASGSVVTFTAEAYNAKGGGEDAQYSWVYGDGMRDATVQSGGKVSHVYKRAGEYEAVVTATKSGLSADARVRVVVTDSPLTLALADDDQDVVVQNTGTVPVDMTGVRLTFTHNTTQTYTFPDKTRILPQKKLTLTLADIGLTDPRRPREVVLIFADGVRKLTAHGVVVVPPPATTAVNAPSAPMTLLGYGKTVPATVSRYTFTTTRPSVSSDKHVLQGNDLAAASSLHSAQLQKAPVAKTHRAATRTKKMLARAQVAPVAARVGATAAPAEVANNTKPHTTEPEYAAATEGGVEEQTATAMNTLPYTPTWVLVVAGLALLGSGLYASWVVGKTA
jgi:hypothetical protein